MIFSVNKTMKRNTQKCFSCQKYYSTLLSEEKEKPALANAFDLVFNIVVSRMRNRKSRHSRQNIYLV